jgi:hypothetical protein
MKWEAGGDRINFGAESFFSKLLEWLESGYV